MLWGHCPHCRHAASVQVFFGVGIHLNLAPSDGAALLAASDIACDYHTTTHAWVPQVLPHSPLLQPFVAAAAAAAGAGAFGLFYCPSLLLSGVFPSRCALGPSFKRWCCTSCRIRLSL
jgi:hypothetical protein